MIWSILHSIDIAIWVIIACSVIYVVFFAIISLFYDKEDRIAAHAAALSNRQCKFLILYPAYKEDRVIINAVENFLLQDYPTTHYMVAVISDHMQPETNDYLRKLPITLLEPVFEKSSKAKAMQYAINEVKGDFDQVVVLDADNVVRPDFLDQLNVLCSIYDAIQCHRCAKNADNDVAVLDGASEEINNTIFRKAHNRIGLSSALIGSGMCFEYKLFKENIFKLSSVGEDKELEAHLLLQKVFIKYEPDIHVFDEKVSNKDNFQKQRLRWMTAQIQSLFMQLPYLPLAIRTGNWDYINKTIQQALIPRSMLVVGAFAWSIFMTVFSLFFSLSWYIKWWCLFLTICISLYLASPKQLRSHTVFGKILSVPVLVWKMFMNIPKISRKTTEFIHTTHDK